LWTSVKKQPTHFQAQLVPFLQDLVLPNIPIDIGTAPSQNQKACSDFSGSRFLPTHPSNNVSHQNNQPKPDI
jgi:hypothetical protein